MTQSKGVRMDSRKLVAPSRPLPDPCPACGAAVPRVAVHGHVQCGACRTNIEPCCEGAPQTPPTKTREMKMDERET